MNPKTKLQEENPKRAAFKRFSKMGAAGLAVLSFSAFTELSAQQLPANIEPDSVKERSFPLVTPSDTSYVNDEFRYLNDYGGHSDYYYPDYSNYCNYYNYGNYSNNYSNYTNTYGDSGYSNNYSNYSNSK